jgi:ubiquinone/menaquinone biosynthesis C-methylase UbiE
MSRYQAIAEYYDAEYGEQRDYLTRDVPYFLGHLPKRGQEVLELAVGTARASIPIAQAGHRVVGVDYSEAMLEVARRKRDGVGLEERELRLVHGDVTTWTTSRRFDWIAVFFNTFLVFTTLEEQDAVLKLARRHLKPGGRLWIDIFHPNLALLTQDRMQNVDPVAFHVPRYDRTVFKTTEIRRHDAGRQIQRVTFHYTWFDHNGRRRRQRTSFDLTFIYPRELQMLLERNGFVIEHLYGDYAGGEISAESERIIASARKG